MVVLLNIIIFASFISLCLINSLTPQAFIIQSSNNRREEDSVIRKVDQVRHVFSFCVEGSVCYYGRVNGVPMGRLGIKENSALVIHAHMKCPIVFDKFPMMAMGFSPVS